MERWTIGQSQVTDHIFLFLSGELPCNATKYQSSFLGIELNTEISKGSGGKRLDLQCRVGDLELNNSEFKRCGTTPAKLEQQFPKNVLISHSMMLYLKDVIDFPLDNCELQALDVHGTYSDAHIMLRPLRPAT
jgi:hypothetical protein